MPVADLEIMRRDLAVYLTTIVRILNSPLHPFDYAAAVGRDSRGRRAVSEGGRQRSRLGADRGRPARAARRNRAHGVSAERGARGTAIRRDDAGRQTHCCAGSHGPSCRSTTRGASASITIPRSSSDRYRGSRLRPRLAAPHRSSAPSSGPRCFGNGTRFGRCSDRFAVRCAPRRSSVR